MTTAIDTRVLIRTARDRVWDVLTDFSRAHEWMAEATDMRQDDATLAVGSVLRFRAQNSDRTSTVEALEPGRMIALASDGPGVHAVYTYTLTDVDGGTEVRLVADVGTSGPMRLLGPVIRGSIAKADGGQLVALARLLTTNDTPA
ncbi:SRPBCC family protein [Occultella aeris]|uniref:Polyketide cyclase / dehydrase and lipid transport n=1 Tax=Occultella aeris TaxID=2761496 RepID=A0A7M4DEA6_9MICO|nr:SRPBCC family protein [Occultella aeris]VZO35220.1 Polyketide cyclase / dehydrase and lipid transport [Occultella aeris]